MMNDKPIRYEETTYGFNYGVADIERLLNDKGRVVLGIKTPRRSLQVQVTKTGLIRVWLGDKELK